MCRFSTLGSNKKGSLLVEALLTIVIMAVGLTFIMQSFLSGFRASAQVEDYSLASVLLEDKMNDLLQVGFIASGVEEEGNFPPPYEDFKYRLTSDNIPEGGREGAINRVALEVSWPSGKKGRSLTAVTYLAHLPK